MEILKFLECLRTPELLIFLCKLDIYKSILILNYIDNFEENLQIYENSKLHLLINLSESLIIKGKHNIAQKYLTNATNILIKNSDSFVGKVVLLDRLLKCLDNVGNSKDLDHILNYSFRNSLDLFMLHAKDKPEQSWWDENELIENYDFRSALLFSMMQFLKYDKKIELLRVLGKEKKHIPFTFTLYMLIQFAKKNNYDDLNKTIEINRHLIPKSIGNYILHLVRDNNSKEILTFLSEFWEQEYKELTQIQKRVEELKIFPKPQTNQDIADFFIEKLGDKNDKIDPIKQDINIFNLPNKYIEIINIQLAEIKSRISYDSQKNICQNLPILYKVLDHIENFNEYFGEQEQFEAKLGKITEIELNLKSIIKLYSDALESGKHFHPQNYTYKCELCNGENSIEIDLPISTMILLFQNEEIDLVNGILNHMILSFYPYGPYKLDFIDRLDKALVELCVLDKKQLDNYLVLKSKNNLLNTHFSPYFIKYLLEIDEYKLAHNEFENYDYNIRNSSFKDIMNMQKKLYLEQNKNTEFKKIIRRREALARGYFSGRYRSTGPFRGKEIERVIFDYIDNGNFIEAAGLIGRRWKEHYMHPDCNDEKCVKYLADKFCSVYKDLDLFEYLDLKL